MKSGENMKATGKQPTVLQMDIIENWAAGLSAKEIAGKLNCSEETVKNTKKIESLRKIYYERQSSQIVELIPLAIKRLTGILKDDNTQAAVQIAAIREVLDRSHLSELMDVTDKDIKITVTYE